MYYPRFTKVIIHYFLTQDKTLSWRNKIRMHTSKDDYLINTLRFISAKEETQIYDAIHPESLTSPEMKETKAYKNYLEPMGKSKRIPLSKKKEKVDVTRGKGIELLSQVALNEDAQFEEVRRKSLRDFHKTNLSGFGAVKIIPSVTSEGTGVKPGVPDVTEEEIPLNVKLNLGANVKMIAKYMNTSSSGCRQQSDQEEMRCEEEMKARTLYDDVDIRRNEPVDTDKEFVQEEGTGAAMTNAAKFLNFSDIPHTDAKIVSPIDVYVHHEVPSQQTPALLTVPVSVISATNPPSTLPDFALVFQFNNKVIALEKEVAELKKDPFHTQVTALVDDHLDTRLGATRDEFMNFLSASLTARIIEQVKNQLPRILLEEVSNFTPPRIRKDKDKDEDPSAGLDRRLKKRKTSKDAEPTTGPKAKESQSGSSKGTNQNLLESLFTQRNQSLRLKIQTCHKIKRRTWSKTFDELMSTLIDFSAFIMNGLKINNLTQETLLGPALTLLKGTHSNYAELEYDFEECYKDLSEKLDWESPEGGDYPFDLTKPLPLVMSRNCQKVHVDYFFNNNLKNMQRGISTMTYTTSLTKTKAAQYDLPGIEDMVPNIWVLVKVPYDKHALWGISHWREQHKSFYGRADNDLYRFKEGDFPRLIINDIEDMLLLVVQNRLTNLSGDDVSDFAIALRMFTKSLVIQKLQTSLDDITKNIRIEYLPKRRWNTLEKKRANIIIKAIDKQLKERRLMRSLEKFIGERHYGTDIRLLQRTI
ncbi:hypothetical protein Tco_1507479 [Tanacetum coccineum]